MSNPIISVRNISKVYRLGEIGVTSLREEIGNSLSKLKRKFTSNQSQLTNDYSEAAGDFWALKDISFDVHPGEVVGIIGKNGAGKSTLLKVISRITEPTSGEIRLRGRIAALLEVGTGFHPELTGRENIYLNGTILGMKKREIDTKLDEIIDFSGIEKHIDTPVKRYSSGMNVRLGFAVAAHLEPEILIVDEVLAVGDAEFQKKCLGKMQDVAGHGRTVLFVSHNMAAVSQLCPHTIVLERGEIINFGESQTVINSYMQTTMPDGSNFSGNGIFRGAAVVDANHQQINSITCGDVLRLKLRLAKKIDLKREIIGVGINDSSGTRITTLSTSFSNNQVTASEGESIICETEPLKLAAGQYSLKVALATDHEQIEAIENALRLTINESNVFGSGKLPSAQQGIILTKSKWIMISNE